MIHEIKLETKTLKGSYLYTPEEAAHPLPLVVWLTGGNDGAQLPLRFSMGKLLEEGTIKPECAVLMPAARYGKNYTTMSVEELCAQIYRAMTEHNVSARISLCGWSLGADAAAILTKDGWHPMRRLCLISNYPKAWKGQKPETEYRLLVGEKEKSAARDWAPYDVERVPGYGHDIGEKIWLDKSIDLLGWLSE